MIIALRHVRLGSPAAVPTSFWRALVRQSRRQTSDKVKIFLREDPTVSLLLFAGVVAQTRQKSRRGGGIPALKKQRVERFETAIVVVDRALAAAAHGGSGAAFAGYTVRCRRVV